MMRVRAAETAFRWMMRVYPARFRQAHGLALFELFRDEAREARAARGRLGLIVFLARSAADTLASAPTMWFDRRYASLPVPVRPFRGLGHDARLAARQLRKAPAFTSVAVLMLAVGIGANTTVFSLLNAVLLRPLATHEPNRVVRVVGRAVNSGAVLRRFSFRDFVDYRDRSTTLESLTGVNLATILLAADNRTDQILGEIGSGQYLSLLGARASQGRLLAESDDVPGAAPVAVISDALWRRRFDRASVVGREVLLNRTSYTIVGVADASVIGSFVAAPIDVWIPIESSGLSLGANWRLDRSQRTLAMIGRLRPGVTRQQAQQELQSIATSLAREFHPLERPVIDVEPGTLATDNQRRLAQVFLSLLLGLAGMVLLIACANVGNLLVARVLGRRRELAIRVALGASRGRLARMLVVEGLIISAAGGAGALALSIWTSRAFAHLSVLPTLALRLDLTPDVRVAGFTALAVAVAAIVLGTVAALQAVAPDIAPALKEDASASIGGRKRARLRSALAALQITVSLLLLVGAALLVRSVKEAAAIELGFDPRDVIALDVDAAGGRTNSESLRFFREVLQRMAALPIVQAAAVSTGAPLDSSTPLVRVNARGAAAAAGDNLSPTVTFTIVSSGYFDVVRIPIVAGRAFAEMDTDDRMRVAIVNETLAARLWPGGEAVGRRLWLEPHASATSCLVVGVAKDSKYLTLGERRQGHVYLPFTQQPRRGMTVLVRSAETPDRLTNAVQEILRTVDPGVQGFFARTLTDHVGVSLLPVRVAATMTIVIATLALGLATVGLYSLLAFLVAERTPEIGVRMALGATAGDVLRLIVGHGLKLTGVGIAVGIPVALATSRLLASLLYGVSPTDPLVFGLVSGLVLVVATAASYFPGRRAMHVDPVVAIRRQ